MIERVMFPVQTEYTKAGGRIDKEIYLRAYEVYSHVYGPQEAMIDLEGSGCRGGFSVGELLAFLYARSFPPQEWRQRVDQALNGGMEKIG